MHLGNSDGLSGVVLASSWEQFGAIISWPWRESGSAESFEDITEQDWPDGDLNHIAEDMEPNQETSESQLPSRRLVRKTPPSEVDEKHSDSLIEHVGQTPVDAPSQPTVQLETAPFLPVLEPATCKTATHRRKSVSVTIANANSVHSTFTKHC